ncbi:hypothetical protein AB4264_24160 [Vibrio sp. 10N.261.55.B8]|uniref:hypothetical protein n=1 Tax=unclassified Vibrio TaxID=2614977 RepID=UPI003551A50E
MKQIILIIMLLFSSQMTFATNSKIDDCPTLSGNGSTMMNQFEEVSKCIDNQRLNNNADKTKNAYENLTDTTIKEIDPLWSYASKLSVIMIIFTFFISILKYFGKIELKTKADISLNIATGVFLSIFAVSPHRIGLLNDFMIEQIQNPALEMFTVANKIQQLSSSDTREVLDYNIIPINEKAQIVSYSILESELCASEYEQNEMIQHDFDDQYTWANNEISLCLDKEKKVAQKVGFMQAGGRSPLNYAVKVCGQKVRGEIYDCGSVRNYSNSSTNKTIDEFAVKYIELANQYQGIICNQESQTDTSYEQAKHLCREWDSESFILKSSNLDVAKANDSVILHTAAFTEALKESIGYEISKDLKTDIDTFSFYSQIRGILSSPFDESEVIEATSKALSGIEVREPFIVNQAFGNETEREQETVLSRIESVEDFYAYIIKEVDSVYASDEINSVITNEFMDAIRDPKRFIGTYEKKGFTVDEVPLKSVQENMIPLATISLGLNFTGKALVNSKNASLKVAGMKAQKLGSMVQNVLILSFCVSIMLFVYIIGNVFSKTYLVLIDVVVKLATNLVGKKSFIAVILAIAEAFMSVSRFVFGVFLSILASTFLSSLLFVLMNEANLLVVGTDSISLDIISPIIFWTVYVLSTMIIFMFSFRNVFEVLEQQTTFNGSIFKAESKGLEQNTRKVAGIVNVIR